MNTKKGGEKARATRIKKYGSYEAYVEHLRAAASKGGKNPNSARNFRDQPGLAKKAGSRGGSAKRRKTT